MTRPDLVADAVAAWVDRDNDKDKATDGMSRYGHYLRDRWHDFVDLDFEPDDPGRGDRDRVVFASWVWRVANGPIMSPALVNTHPRVQSITAVPDDWDYRHLLITAELVSALPAGMNTALGWKWTGLEHSTYWGYQWPDRSRSQNPPHLALPTLTLAFPIPADTLPTAPRVTAGTVRHQHVGDGPLITAAYAAVDAVTDHVNRTLRPALAHLDPPGQQR